MSLIFGNHPQVEPGKDEPGAVLIKEVRAYVFDNDQHEKECGGGADCHSQSSGHWIIDSNIATPMSAYEQYRNGAGRTSWGIDAMGSVVCEIILTNGTTGVGMSIGGDAACYVIEKHFARFVEKQDPTNVELIWDQMYNSCLNYGRKGLAIQALSAVDIAIWDALGKLRNLPVYKMLGGQTKQMIPVYATTSRPDLAKSMGFHGAKFPLPYGPSSGEQGMNDNIELVKKWREAVGPNFPLMIDCYMSLTVPYAIELAKKCEPYNVKWIEECLPPDDYTGYAEIKAKSTTSSTNLWTTGEHEYTRWGFLQLLQNKCCDVLQPDITWCGGITEARRIIALASAYNIPVVPHGSSVYSYHLQICYPNCPIAEFLIMSPKADRIVSFFGNLFTDEPLPNAQGYIELSPTKPGFGVTLNREALQQIMKRPYPRNT